MKIYLSPSTQYSNMYYGGRTNEMAQMEALAGILKTKLSHYICEVIFKPRTSASSAQDRINDANAINADYFLALHTNAGHGAGCEVYYQTGWNHPALVKSRSLNFASKVINEISKITTTNTTVNDRGLKSRRNVAGLDSNMDLRGCKMPAVLAEIEFHDTPAGSAWIIANLDLTAGALLKAIVAQTGIVLKPVPVPTPLPKPVPLDEFWFIQTSAHKTLTDARVEAMKIAKAIGKPVAIKYGSTDDMKYVETVKN